MIARPPRVGETNVGARPRKWHGRTHTVLVLADGGLEHEGRRYASLTRLARAITGAHWSGPRFFGLRRGTRSADARNKADRGGDA